MAIPLGPATSTTVANLGAPTSTSASGPMGGYTQVSNGNGGYNYFGPAGQPITVQQYGAAKGMSSQDVATLAAQGQPAAGAATNNTPPASGSGTNNLQTQNDIKVQLANLGSRDTQTNNDNAAIDKKAGEIGSQYDAETANAEGQYSDSSTQNRGTLETNKQTAMVNAAQGRNGLFGTLAGLGALNGSGIELANNAVKEGANADLAGANSSFATNQHALDQAIGDFRTADKQRRADLATATSDSKKQNQYNADADKVKIYTTLSNDYAAAGDSANAGKYADLAASLAPDMAANNVPSTTLGYQAATFSAPTLQSYLAGNGSTAVNATPSTPGQGGSGGGAPGLFAGLVPGLQKQQG